MRFKPSSLNNALKVIIFSCAALGGTLANAAENPRYTINLSATIPTDSFYVVPVDTGWINQKQFMEYNISTKKLKNFEKQFQFKNVSGAIQATLNGDLDNSGKPILSNGKDTIPLAVTFNNVALSKTAATVVAAAEAKGGGRSTLIIAQDDDKALTADGTFTGSVSMIFEPIVPPES